MKILNLSEIKTILENINVIPMIEKGFVEYSKGNTVVPPIGELLFNEPPGDVHIKYGYIIGDDYYVIKIASGFYLNPQLNLSSSNGLMLLFKQQTGELLAILLDEGYLTNLRTAAAGAIAAKYLAPKKVRLIGIVGTGIQAHMQLQYLAKITPCRNVIVYGRDSAKLTSFKNNMQIHGWKISITQKIEDIALNCNLIVTTTPATSPLLFANQIQAGTHITAVGTDSKHKQEIDEYIFAKANLIVADSIEQCIERGDIAHAYAKNLIDEQRIVELGEIIAGLKPGRLNEEQITIADLTGLAVQDIQIAKAIYSAA